MDYSIKTLNQLGISLRSARKGSKTTQIAASERFGILPKTISLLENDPGRGSIDSLFKLLAAIGYEITLTPRDKENPDWDGEW